MSTTNYPIEEYFDVVIVGAGPAGIGVGILLQKLGISYVLLEKTSIGASFKNWPKETRFISPSFTGNFFKMPDLNAVTPDTSPAFDLLTEHPTGEEYAIYLEQVSKFFDLLISTGVEVKSIEDKNGGFFLDTNRGMYASSFVIWAAGEYQYPKTNSFKGDHRCMHYSEVDSFSDILGANSVVIGAYESGFDAAINLAKIGKKVTLIDNSNYLELIKSDSSYSLSPFTRDRMKEALDDIEYFEETRVKEVKFLNAKFIVTPNKEEHGAALFCFIYKYRQRFAVVVEEIAKRNEIPLGKIEEVLKEYKNNNFYLTDLSCCDDECVC